MAKLNSERALRERRELKQAKKQARREAAAAAPAVRGVTDAREASSEVQ